MNLEASANTSMWWRFVEFPTESVPSQMNLEASAKFPSQMNLEASAKLEDKSICWRFVKFPNDSPLPNEFGSICKLLNKSMCWRFVKFPKESRICWRFVKFPLKNWHQPHVWATAYFKERKWQNCSVKWYTLIRPIVLRQNTCPSPMKKQAIFKKNRWCSSLLSAS